MKKFNCTEPDNEIRCKENSIEIDYLNGDDKWIILGKDINNFIRFINSFDKRQSSIFEFNKKSLVSCVSKLNEIGKEFNVILKDLINKEQVEEFNEEFYYLNAFIMSNFDKDIYKGHDKEYQKYLFNVLEEVFQLLTDIQIDINSLSNIVFHKYINNEIDNLDKAAITYFMDLTKDLNIDIDCISWMIHYIDRIK